MRDPLLTLAVLYFAMISLVAVLMTVTDKIKAKRGSWRVPERVLLTVSIMGGALAMYATMRLIRHKTKHKKFMIGLPIVILLQLSLLLYSLYRMEIF